MVLEKGSDYGLELTLLWLMTVIFQDSYLTLLALGLSVRQIFLF